MLEQPGRAPVARLSSWLACLAALDLIGGAGCGGVSGTGDSLALDAAAADGAAADAGPPADVRAMADQAAGTDLRPGRDSGARRDTATPPPDASADAAPQRYPAERCTFFLTGEVDLEGSDADNDGAPNGWDVCPNNPHEWLDSDRDGVGNHSDPDLDGDGVPNEEDPDRDGDGASDEAERASGTDPTDPASIPGLRRLDLDLGVLDPSPGWYRGDLHVHTEYSHDSSAKIASYLESAAEAGLDFLWITDHNTFGAPFDPAWDQPELLLIPGVEWGSPGHANLAGIRTEIASIPGDPVEVRRSWRLAWLQGAVQSLNHYGGQVDYWTGLFDAAPDLLDALDVVEVWNGLWPFNSDVNEASLAFYDGLLAQGRQVGAVGGSDTHYARLQLGFPTTVVWAESLSVPGILDGVRRGRTYITQSEPFADGLQPSWEGRAELDFRVDADGDGVFEAMLGDTVPPGRVAFRVAVRHAHGPVVLRCSGEEIARFDAHEAGADISHSVAHDAPPGSWCRVEMRKSALQSAALLLLSSPIYVGE